MFIEVILGTAYIKAKIIVPDRELTVTLPILRNGPYGARLVVVLFHNSAPGLGPRTAHRDVI